MSCFDVDRRGEVVVIYCGRRPQPSLEVWVGQVGVVGYEPFYVWVIVELRRSIPMPEGYCRLEAANLGDLMR